MSRHDKVEAKQELINTAKEIRVTSDGQRVVFPCTWGIQTKRGLSKEFALTVFNLENEFLLNNKRDSLGIACDEKLAMYV